MISVKELGKDYSGFSLNISMEIQAGRVSGLVGRNGAGKSTTIKAILGLINPDRGSVTVMGKEARSMSPEDKQQLGVAMSESGFSSQLTVNTISLILRNMYRDLDRDAFLKACAAQSLPADKKIGEFSTGMRAKLRVLTALSHKARLLIMDEPTAGLDIEARNEILDMIRDYLRQNEDSSLLISSHISSDLEGLCDDIYLIHDGRLILHEDTDRLLDSYGVIKVDEETYRNLDKTYILGSRKESYGYKCFTGEKQFYEENFPGAVIENGSIDELILIMAGGEKS